MSSSSDAHETDVPQKQRLLRETALFGLSYRIFQGLMRGVPFEEFKRRLEEERETGYTRDELPSGKTLRHLYERGIDARTERSWIVAVKGLAGSGRSKKYRAWLLNAISLAQDLEKTLSEADPALLPRPDARTAMAVAESVKSFRQRLLEIERLDRRWNDLARTHNWNSSLRQARIGMDRILREECPHLDKTQRLDLVRATVRSVGLNTRETTEAIERQLSRARARAKARALHRRGTARIPRVRRPR